MYVGYSMVLTRSVQHLTARTLPGRSVIQFYAPCSMLLLALGPHSCAPCGCSCFYRTGKLNVLNTVNKEFNKLILLILYRLVDRGSIPCVSRNVPSHDSLQTGHGTQPVDTESLFTGQTKWPESGGDHIVVPSVIMHGAVATLPNIYYVVFPWRNGRGIFFHRGSKNDIGVYSLATRNSCQCECVVLLH
jgi:hypothetical protein